MPLLWFFLACPAPTPPAPPAESETPPRPSGLIRVVERWEPVDSGRLCLIFYDNGDLTIAITDGASPGKVEVTSRYTRTENALQIMPRRIYRHRHVSRCREHVEPARELEEEDVLGLTIVPGESATFTIRTLSESRLELCGVPERCVLLGRVEP